MFKRCLDLGLAHGKKKSFKSKSFNDIGVSLVWLSVLGQEKLVASLSMQAFVQSLFMFSLLFC